MAHIVTEIVSFDNKRNKVTLDYGEVTFLLYKGECRKLGLLTANRGGSGQGSYCHNENACSESTETADKKSAAKVNSDINETAYKELSEAGYRSIMDEILLPRAKKRVLYYLKSADKTREQIRRKLREGYYPDEVIEETFKFLDKYGFADDTRYAESYVEELKGSKSKREISQKLASRGIKGEQAAGIIASISDEDEYAACVKAFKKKYAHGITKEERQKAFAYLARRGFSYDAIEHAMQEEAFDPTL